MYMITADLVKRDENDIWGICHDELEVEVMPSIKAPPPLQLVHYPSGFMINSQSSLRRHFWCRSMGTLRVSSLEPEAINLAVSTPRATTLVVAKMTLTPHQNFAALLRPYEWEIISKTWLKARTFCSTKVFEEIPIIPLLKADPSLQMHVEITESESRKCNSPRWRLDRLSTQGTIDSAEGLAPWTTFLRIPISTPKHLVPTFLTALAAHRYSLCMLLSITGFSHRPLYLEVPVQVAYDDTQKDSRMKDVNQSKEQQDLGHSPEQLPKYSYFY